MKSLKNSRRIAAVILILATILASCVAMTPPIKTPNSIASLEKVRIGGVDQWILIRGTDRSNPVLLFLHGGPGAAEMTTEHYFGPELEKHFVVVHWDQRGAGKSYSLKIPRESMNINQFVSDAHELVLLLRERFNTDKIYLMGHSWGSMLGVWLVQKYPELFCAYIGIGQVVDIERNEAVSYRFVLDEAKNRNNKTALRQLEKIGPPPYENRPERMTQRNWLNRFGGAAYQKSSMGWMIKIALGAKEYTAGDFVKFLIGVEYSDKLMEDQLLNVNFLKDAPRLEIPVYFFAGRHDYNTPWELVQEYYDKLDAPKGKHLVWFENSAHSPNLEEPEKFSRVMVDQVLKDTYLKP